MSLHKHIINDPATLVVDSLRGLVQLNPSVKLDEPQRVVYRAPSESEPHVALLSGGGSGHEPAHAGFVGEGLLDAAVCGNIFASPSVPQIRRGIELVTRGKGALLVVKNYTGDALHFGLAAEQHKSAGLVGDVRVLMIGDDVAVGREQGSIVGRRGLAGVLLVYKILAALSKTGADLGAVESLGKYIATRLVTLGVGLDHCHVPGTRKGDSNLSDTELEIGMGIHNEPGALKEPIRAASELVGDMLSRLTNTSDADRSFVPFSGIGDEVVLMVNNLGSISELEMGLIVDEALSWLNSKGFKVRRVLSGTYITSLNMPGFSLTLLLLPRRGEQYDTQTVLEYLDAEVDAPGWKWNSRKEPGVIRSNDASVFERKTPAREVSLAPQDREELLAGIARACQALIAAEPELTMQDQIAGDGDAGLTLKAGAEQVLSAIQTGQIKGFNVLEDLGVIAESVEGSMGGTSGALYSSASIVCHVPLGAFLISSIFFSGLRTSLRSTGASKATPEVWATAAQGALETLYKYTRARPPSRTLVDPLEAFITSLRSKSLSDAAKDALDAADKTKELVAKAGRGAYVNQDDLKERQVPDPGAWGIWRIVDGLSGYEA